MNRTETVARLAELGFIEHFEHLTDGLLHHTVDYRRDAKPTFLAVRLRYLYPADGIRFVCSFAEGCNKFRAMLSKIWEQAFCTHSVYSAAALVALHLLIGGIQVRG